MDKRLTADMNVVANSNLEIQLLDGDLNVIQKLDDEPNDVGGLTSAELKAKFDESGNIIKKYINETLIPAVLTDDATEESRKQAEAAREAAEQGRVTAEEGRKAAETARANAETNRQAAETRRGDAETSRASAESERRNAESSRVTAEGGRASAEASRVTAEQGRTSAESIRVQDEQKRVSAENGRVEAEAQRAAAEQARADENTGIVAQATAQANAAAQSAGIASASAQTAQSAASSAGTAASTASSAATSASGSASQAQASAAAAAQSAASVDGINKTAQSWAVGGTGTRPGEDTDNAKYWAQQAQAVVGDDFATKVEAQGYVTAHNQSADAHADIRKALNGKEPSGTAAAAVAAHNTDATAHSDIREALSKAGKEFIINGTLTFGEAFSVDKTRAEVKAAVQAGESVMLRINDAYATVDLPLTQVSFLDANDIDVYCFGAVMIEGDLAFATLQYIGTQYRATLSTAGIPPLSDDAPSAPGTASAGTSDNAARGDHVHPSERPKATQVTLTAAGWDSGTKKQTVTVSGVLADTSKQVIWVAFASETALDAYMDAGIVPVAQGANTVTFRADKIPTADISVTVLMQGVLT